MQKVTFNEIEYSVADQLDGFTILQKKSSNVAFFGFKANTMFVQFMNGASYLYELSLEAVKEALNAESIGKFVANQVVNKVPSQKIENNQVKPDGRVIVLLRKDILSGKHKPYGRLNEQVYLVSEDNGTCLVESIKTGDRFPVTSDNLLRKKAA